MKDVKLGKYTLQAPKTTRDFMALALALVALVGIVFACIFSGNPPAAILAGVVPMISIFQGEPAYKVNPSQRRGLFVAYGIVAVLSIGLSLLIVVAGHTTLFATENEVASMARGYWIAVGAALVASLTWFVKLKMDPPS
jgi:hypothetical protein